VAGTMAVIAGATAGLAGAVKMGVPGGECLSHAGYPGARPRWRSG